MNLSTQSTANVSAALAEHSTKQFMNQLQTLMVLLIKTQLILKEIASVASKVALPAHAMHMLALALV
jgi:hypothetical protein